MNRYTSKAARLLKLERLLARHTNGVSVIDLAKELGVHRSTIYRDIELLDQIGLPIWQDRGLVGLLVNDYLLPLCLNIYEALSLFIAARLLSRQSGERDPHVESLLEKLADILPQPVSSHLQKSAQVLKERPENQKYVKHLEILIWAWIHRRRVRIWYQSAWKNLVKERLFDVFFIEPLEMFYSYYVIGLDHWYDEVRTFKIKRIQRIEVTDDVYTIPNDFNIFDRWVNSWGIVINPESPLIKVKLRFSKDISFMIKEAVWHNSQQIEDLSDGGCIFTALVDHTLGIKLWIRTWGSDVEVLEPESLRLEVVNEVNKLGMLYNKIGLSEPRVDSDKYPL